MNLSFATPWLLGLLATLPVLWWLLRLTPPQPKQITFPALALLRDLVTPRQTPAHTPWWLLALRLVLATLMIVALARPLLNPPQALPTQGPILIAVDNDWAAARAWVTRQRLLNNLIDQAEREHRDVILLPTAPPAQGGPVASTGPYAAASARADAARLAPQPWPSDWNAAATIARALDHATIHHVVWLNSGLGGTDAEAFSAALNAFTSPQSFSDAETTPLTLLLPPHTEDDQQKFGLARAAAVGPDTLSVSALDANGDSLAQIPVTFAPKTLLTQQPFDLPLDIRNRIVRLAVEGPPMVATTVLLDESTRRRPVGLVGDKTEASEHSLLSGLYYLNRALKPYADLHFGTIQELLDQNMAVLILTDATLLRDNEITALKNWLQQGGVLVRFAGDHLAANSYAPEQELLPVTLRRGDRALGGAMSWATPQHLRDFPVASPFLGFPIAPDVTVSRQLLAEPTPELSAHTWATLQDGTPLVTAQSFGRGTSILFHVSAQPGWSSLPLSGLFVDMLRRIVEISQGVTTTRNDEAQPPHSALDAFANLGPPEAAAQPLTDFAHTPPSPQHPPGLYGNDLGGRAFNIGTGLPLPEAFHDPSTLPYPDVLQAIDLQPWLLLIVILLFLADFLLSLHLRGLLATSLLLALLVTPVGAQAAPPDPIALTAKTYLAYVITGSSSTDSLSAAGLAGLARILQQRTTLDRIDVIGVDPARDELAFFPLLYWPLHPAAPPPSPATAARVNDYLRHGGMILFDTQTPEAAAVITPTSLAGIDMPPLIRLPENHVMTHSFFRLSEFPGRFDNGAPWIEPEQSAAYDGVASVLVGSNNWVGAWATDASGLPLYPCIPGGEPQRELAYRFGVNLVMLALTGNYKADQIHAKALLERATLPVTP